MARNAIQTQPIATTFYTNTTIVNVSCQLITCPLSKKTRVEKVTMTTDVDINTIHSGITHAMKCQIHTLTIVIISIFLRSA